MEEDSKVHTDKMYKRAMAKRANLRTAEDLFWIDEWWRINPNG